MEGILQNSSRALEKIKSGKLKRTKQWLQNIHAHVSELENHTNSTEIEPLVQQIKDKVKKALTIYDQAILNPEKKQNFLSLLEGYVKRITEKAKQISQKLTAISNDGFNSSHLSKEQLAALLKADNIHSKIDSYEVEEMRRKIFQRGFNDQDLSGLNLDGLNLKGMSLKNANLMNSSLVGTDLEGADLEDADLTNTNFSKAKLSLANFKRAKIIGTDFSQADLMGCSFEQAKLEDPNFSGAKITSGTNFTQASLERVNFSGLNLEGVSFRQASILRSYFKDICLEMSNFENAHLFYTDFDRANLKNSCFNGVRCISVRFDNANLTKAKFNEAVFHEHFNAEELVNSSFTQANLEGAEFSFSSFLSLVEMKQANLRKAKFNGSLIEKVNFSKADVSLVNFKDAKSVDWERLKEVKNLG